MFVNLEALTFENTLEPLITFILKFVHNLFTLINLVKIKFVFNNAMFSFINSSNLGYILNSIFIFCHYHT